MLETTHQAKQISTKATDYIDRSAFRKKVEVALSALSERLPGGQRNRLKIRASNRFLRSLYRAGINLRSDSKELQLILENKLDTPLTRLISTGQLTYGDVLIIRMQEQTGEIQIERVSSRERKESAFGGKML